MEKGNRIVFKNSVKCVMTSPEGRIIEYGPIIGCMYEVCPCDHTDITFFRNVEQPHHTVDWYLVGDCFSDTNVVALHFLVKS